MNKAWLEIVMPASLVLIFCTVMVFGFSMSGLLAEPVPAQTELPGGPSEPTAGSALPTRLPTGANAAAVAAGETLFQGNCAQCHAVHEVVVGPALAGVRKRRPEKWLISWVKNSSKMVASGDEYVVKIFNQYQKQQMPSYQLSDQEVSHILAYVEYAGATQPTGSVD